MFLSFPQEHQQPRDPHDNSEMSSNISKLLDSFLSGQVAHGVCETGEGEAGLLVPTGGLWHVFSPEVHLPSVSLLKSASQCLLCDTPLPGVPHMSLEYGGTLSSGGRISTFIFFFNKIDCHMLSVCG